MAKKIPCTVTENKRGGSIELDKRQHVPFTVHAECPKCGKKLTRDLGAGTDHYLSYPHLGKPCEVYFVCYGAGNGDDENAECSEFQVKVIPRLTLEAA